MYEDMDGIKTIHTRSSTAAYDDESLLERWVKWQHILRDAQENSVLASAIEQVEILYELGRTPTQD